MSFLLKDLNEEIRRLMQEEVNMDIKNNVLYISKRLSPDGKTLYPQLLLDAIQKGNIESFSSSLKEKMNLTETRRTKMDEKYPLKCQKQHT